MKYIIDIEDEYTKDWVTETPMCKKLCMPISVPNRQRTYHVVTGFKLEPYTEPDRKAIEDAQGEAWELARKIANMRHEEFSKCFDVTDDYCEFNIMDIMSYSEAKSKYEAWKKQKDEVHVGDEVIPTDTQYDTMIVTRIWMDDHSRDCLDTLGLDGCICSFLTSNVKKTGRHFDEIEELLKKMREEEE